MQAETCCSLPRTPAICSTDCTETHTASPTATPLGERVTRGSLTSSGLSPLYVLTALTCLCWFGSLSNLPNNLIILHVSDKLRIHSMSDRQRGRLHKREGNEKWTKGKKSRSIVMFVFDRWGMPPIDFVREARNRGREIKARVQWWFQIVKRNKCQHSQFQPY